MKQKDTLMIVGIVVLVLLLSGGIGMMSFGGRGMMGSYYGQGLPLMLLITLIIIVVIIVIFNQLNGRTMKYGKKK